MRLLKLIVILLVFLTSSCGLEENLCILERPEQEMLDMANRDFGSSLIVKRIPCEGIYIRVELLNNSVSDSTLNRLHSILFDKSTNRGWQTLWVYDKNGDYLFSHSYTGKKFLQSGD